MHKSSLGKHKIEFSIQSSPSFLDCAGVYQASDSAVDFSQISPRDHGRWLVIDTNLETRGTPIYKRNRFPILDFRDGGIDILGRYLQFFYSKNARENVTENTAYISTIQQTDGHVFACARVTLDHLVFGLKAVLCYFCYANLFVVCLRNNRNGDVNAHCIPSLPSKNATYTLSAEMIGL